MYIQTIECTIQGDNRMKTFTVQVAHLVREYANVEIQAENERDAIHQAYDVDWDQLPDDDIRLDYEYTESLQPVVIDERDLPRVK